MTDPLVQRLPANSSGRDFIAGDLHGYPGVLHEFLTEQRFDPSAGDRLLLVGDLVDRGPENLRALALLAEPGVHAVRGNHEEWLLAVVPPILAGRSPDPEAESLWGMNGGGWARDALRDGVQRQELAAATERVRRLPYVLQVGEGVHRYHVVHAELPPWVQDAAIDAGLPDVDPEELVMSRAIMGAPNGIYPDERAGLSPTFAGHTPVDAPLTRSGITDLDAGLFVFGRLVIAEVAPQADTLRVRYHHHQVGTPGFRRAD